MSDRFPTTSAGSTMADKENVSVDDLKAEGNAFYKQGKYLKAAASYSKAIKKDKDNGVLYRCVPPFPLSLSKPPSLPAKPRERGMAGA